MKKLIGAPALAVTAVLALSSCKHTDPVAKSQPQPAIVAAKQACEIDALAEERKTYVERVAGIAAKEKEATETNLSGKLKEHRAEIDASYRFVVANCNNYNLCMQAHAYDEGKCTSARAQWTESHAKFNTLAQDLIRYENPPKKDTNGGEAGSAPKNPKGDCNPDFPTPACKLGSDGD